MTTTHDIWMPLYIGDYLADTMHLSAEEHGAYLLAIMHYWKSGGAIPKTALKNICRCGEEALTTVLTFFREEAGLLHHARIEAEMVKAKDSREANKKKTQAATEARIAKAKAKAEAEKQSSVVTPIVTLNVTESQSQSQSHLPSQTHSKSESKEEGDFLNFKNDLGLDFNINNFLTPELEMYAQETARLLNLDYLSLIDKYNKLVKRDPPKFPNKAFMAWMTSYTKPIIQKRNGR